MRVCSDLMILAVLQEFWPRTRTKRERERKKKKRDEKNRPRPDWHQNTQHTTGSVPYVSFNLEKKEKKRLNENCALDGTQQQLERGIRVKETVATFCHLFPSSFDLGWGGTCRIKTRWKDNSVYFFILSTTQ